MKNRNFRHVFGPVPSRRLGLSLGIDVVPFKTCSYDCIYCRLGRTTCKTTALSEYVPAAEVLSELDSRLAPGIQPDYITLSGSGEPTLNSEIGRLIQGIKLRTSIPVAVLDHQQETNVEGHQDPGAKGRDHRIAQTKTVHSR